MLNPFLRRDNEVRQHRSLSALGGRFKPYLKLLLEARKKLPRHEGKLYRGIKITADTGPELIQFWKVFPVPLPRLWPELEEPGGW